MPKAHALIFRVPLAKPVGAARSHVIANAPQLSAVYRIRSVVIRVYASDTAHV
jgi:hypothetical protein